MVFWACQASCEHGFRLVSTVMGLYFNDVMHLRGHGLVRTSHCGRSLALARPSLLPQWDLGTPL